MKNYAPNDGDQHGYGYGFLWWESKDEAIPAKPIVRYTGPAGFPAGQLLFQVSAPAAPPKITNSVVAVQWRAAQISAPGLAGYVAGQPRRYEMEQPWPLRPANCACRGRSARHRLRLSRRCSLPGHQRTMGTLV